MSGCQDKQLSQAQTFSFPDNSLFTAMMLQLLETLGLKALEIPTDPRTGVSVEALTALNYAAKLSDVSTEGLTKALQKLSVAMFDTQINGVEGSAALKALGVSATDVNGQIRPTEQVLLDLAEKFSAMPDGADKAALAVCRTASAGAPALIITIVPCIIVTSTRASIRGSLSLSRSPSCLARRSNL